MGNYDVTIDDRRLFELYRYWLAKRGRRAMPARRDIDPIEMRPLLGNLTLIDVCREPLAFRFRLVGCRIADLFGKELTGRRVDDLRYFGKRPPFDNQCGDVATNQRPSFMIMLLGAEHRRVVYRHLLLPLSSDGETVDMLLGGSVFVPAPIKQNRSRSINEW